MSAVVDVRHARYDVYIGRENHSYKLPASKWANPFLMGVDGTREEVIAKYEAYIRAEPELMAALPELEGKILGCWCAPEACHGDVLVRLVAEVCQRRYPLEEATALATRLHMLLEPLCERIEIAGSIRRQKPMVKDIEFVCVPRVKEIASDLFGNTTNEHDELHAWCAQAIADGIFEHRLGSDGKRSFGRRYKRLRVRSGIYAPGIGLDLFCVLPPAQYGLQMVIRTGPHEFSKQVVTPQGRLTVDGRPGLLPVGHRVKGVCIWRVDGAGNPVEVVETPEEADVFAFLGIPYVEPEGRS